MATLEACNKYFGSKDIYEIFGIPKTTSNEKESWCIHYLIDQIEHSMFIFNLFIVKKAYYKKALLVHPDRVPDEEKIEATEKFKVSTEKETLASNNVYYF